MRSDSQTINDAIVSPFISGTKVSKQHKLANREYHHKPYLSHFSEGIQAAYCELKNSKPASEGASPLSLIN